MSRLIAYVILYSMKRIKGKHLDFSQIAHAVVEAATNETPAQEEPPSNKNPAAVALGKLGGPKGGKAAAAHMTAKQRKARAKKAAEARWENKKND